MLFSSYTRLKNIPPCSFAREPNNVKPRDVCATFFKLLRLAFLSPFGTACTARVRAALDDSSTISLSAIPLISFFSFFFYLSWDLTDKMGSRGIQKFFRLREISLTFLCLEVCFFFVFFYFEIFLSPYYVP